MHKLFKNKISQNKITWFVRSLIQCLMRNHILIMQWKTVNQSRLTTVGDGTMIEPRCVYIYAVSWPCCNAFWTCWAFIWRSVRAACSFYRFNKMNHIYGNGYRNPWLGFQSAPSGSGRATWWCYFWRELETHENPNHKVGFVFAMVAVSIPSRAEFGQNDHPKDAFHLTECDQGVLQYEPFLFHSFPNLDQGLFTTSKIYFMLMWNYSL